MPISMGRIGHVFEDVVRIDLVFTLPSRGALCRLSAWAPREGSDTLAAGCRTKSIGALEDVDVEPVRLVVLAGSRLIGQGATARSRECARTFAEVAHEGEDLAYSTGRRSGRAPHRACRRRAARARPRRSRAGRSCRNQASTCSGSQITESSNGGGVGLRRAFDGRAERRRLWKARACSKAIELVEVTVQHGLRLADVLIARRRRERGRTSRH